jgi:hypothetical protein
MEREVSITPLREFDHQLLQNTLLADLGKHRQEPFQELQPPQELHQQQIWADVYSELTREPVSPLSIIIIIPCTKSNGDPKSTTRIDTARTSKRTFGLQLGLLLPSDRLQVIPGLPHPIPSRRIRFRLGKHPITHSI